MLGWDGYLNCRDLGGLPTPAGPTRPGRIARGPRRELLSPAGWAAAREWGLRTIVDLRCAYEVGLRDGDPVPDGTVMDGVSVRSAPTEDHSSEEFRRTCFPILDSPACWSHNLRILPDLVRRALEVIAACEPGVLIHCSAGRDRTGMISALLLANAGVAPEVVAEDYAVSVRQLAGARTRSPTVDRQEAWRPADAEAWIAQVCPIVVAFAEGVGELLDQVGLQDDDRLRLRTLLLPA
ncbi:MAG: tyrosine-protein phosphatase [Propionicimonas sp.]